MYALMNALIDEGYSVKELDGGRVQITNAHMPEWAISLEMWTSPQLCTYITMTSGDGFQSRTYNSECWRDALDDIFFMYHCFVK